MHNDTTLRKRRMQQNIRYSAAESSVWGAFMALRQKSVAAMGKAMKSVQKKAGKVRGTRSHWYDHTHFLQVKKTQEQKRPRAVRKRRKVMWFEKFNWFISSEVSARFVR